MSEKLNLVGKLFGRLTVLHPGEKTKLGRTTWLCLCDCGNKTCVDTNSLSRGRTHSCGCLRKEVHRKPQDFVGKRFGKIVVLSGAEKPDHVKGSDAFWLCQCDCGNQKTIRGRNLKRGDTLSCGCLRFERTAKYLHQRTPKKRSEALSKRTEKKCPQCKETKPTDKFPKNSCTNDGLGCYCKPCHNRQGRENRKKNHGSRGYHLKRRYGITQGDFDRMVEEQGGKCAICQDPPSGIKPWHVDHDHSSGKVRGILCHSCNTALGNFNDDSENLQRALDYLR